MIRPNESLMPFTRRGNAETRRRGEKPKSEADLASRPRVPRPRVSASFHSPLHPPCVRAAAQADEKPVSYYHDIRPIFNSDCNACHKPEKLKGQSGHDDVRPP